MKLELEERIMDWFHSSIDGGTALFNLEDMIDEGVVTLDEYQDNEMAICHLFDNNYFYCVTCGWTLTTGDMGEDTEGGELQCIQCENEAY